MGTDTLDVIIIDFNGIAIYRVPTGSGVLNMDKRRLCRGREYHRDRSHRDRSHRDRSHRDRSQRTRNQRTRNHRYKGHHTFPVAKSFGYVRFVLAIIEARSSFTSTIPSLIFQFQIYWLTPFTLWPHGQFAYTSLQLVTDALTVSAYITSDRTRPDP